MIRAIIVAMSLLVATFAYAAEPPAVCGGQWVDDHTYTSHPECRKPVPICTLPLTEVEASVVGKQGAVAEYIVSGASIISYLKKLQDIPLPQKFWDGIEGVDRIVGYGKADMPRIKVFYYKQGCVVGGAYSDRPTMDQLTGEKI